MTSSTEAASPLSPPGPVDAVRTHRAIAILRLRDHTHAVATAEALYAGGIRVLEVTLDHPDAPDSIAQIRSRLPGDLVVGGGTVLTAEDVETCRDSGGTFCVSPHVDADLVRHCLALGLDAFPGVATASEVVLARRAGAMLLKLFPAGALGVSYLAALRGPFGDVEFVPTGGVRHDDLAPWFGAGATAVGLGSDLVPSRPTPADLPRITERARTVLASTRALHPGHDR